MIPVPNQCLIKLNINSISEEARRRKIKSELSFCRKNIHKIKLQANKTFDAVTNTNNKRIQKNSCDFKLLERKCQEYINLRKNDLKIPNNDKWFLKVNSKQAEQLRTAGISFDGKVFTDKESVIKINIQDKDKALSLLNSKNIRK